MELGDVLEKSPNVMNAHALGDLIKFKLPPIKHCLMCYLLTPADEGEKPFNRSGKRGKCSIFASAATKASALGSATWGTEGRVG
jgi:hypothetical protein